MLNMNAFGNNSNYFAISDSDNLNKDVEILQVLTLYEMFQ